MICQALEEAKELESTEKEGAKEELETLKKEQDDLLVLLADQDAKITKFKDKLKELGVEVSFVIFPIFVIYDTMIYLH